MANPETTKNSTRLPTLAHTKIGKAKSNSGGSVTTNTMYSAATASVGKRMRAMVLATAAMMRCP